MLGALRAHAFLLGSDGSYHEWDAARYEVRALGKNLAKPPRSPRFSGQKKEKDHQICQGINRVATIVFQKSHNPLSPKLFFALFSGKSLRSWRLCETFSIIAAV